MRRILKASAALVIVPLALCGADAAELYKSTMPDGKSVYGDRPARGAVNVEKIETPPAQTGVQIVTPEETARARQIQPPAGPAVTIIPQRPRDPIQSLPQGGLQNPQGDLPKPAQY